MENGKELGECDRCGSPASAELCGTCRQMDKLIEMSARPSPNKAEANEPSQSLKKRGELTCSQTKGTAGL